MLDALLALFLGGVAYVSYALQVYFVALVWLNGAHLCLCFLHIPVLGSLVYSHASLAVALTCFRGCAVVPLLTSYMWRLAFSRSFQQVRPCRLRSLYTGARHGALFSVLPSLPVQTDASRGLGCAISVCRH